MINAVKNLVSNHHCCGEQACGHGRYCGSVNAILLSRLVRSPECLNNYNTTLCTGYSFRLLQQAKILGQGYPSAPAALRARMCSTRQTSERLFRSFWRRLRGGQTQVLCVRGDYLHAALQFLTVYFGRVFGHCIVVIESILLTEQGIIQEDSNPALATSC